MMSIFTEINLTALAAAIEGHLNAFKTLESWVVCHDWNGNKRRPPANTIITTATAHHATSNGDRLMMERLFLIYVSSEQIIECAIEWTRLG